MFCTNCGKEIKDQSVFCSYCGQKIIVSETTNDMDSGLNLITEFKTAKDDFVKRISGISSSQDNRIFSNQHPYHRLGGWLAFFTYCQLLASVAIAISALLVFATIIKYAMYFNGIFLMYVLLFFIAAGIEIYFCVRLYNLVTQKDAEFLHFYEFSRLAYGGCYMLAEFIGHFAGIVSLEQVWSGGIVLVCTAGIWLTYFQKSVRVRTYFETDEYLKRSMFFSGVIPPDPAD